MRKNMNLKETGNRLPFTVPENYFEDFADRFESRILVKQPSKLKLMRPWMYAAAIFAGVFFMSRIAYKTYTNNKIAAAENYELYILAQVNDVENLQYLETEQTTNDKK